MTAEFKDLTEKIQRLHEDARGGQGVGKTAGKRGILKMGPKQLGVELIGGKAGTLEFSDKSSEACDRPWPDRPPCDPHCCCDRPYRR